MKCVSQGPPVCVYVSVCGRIIFLISYEHTSVHFVLLCYGVSSPIDWRSQKPNIYLISCYAYYNKNTKAFALLYDFFG